MKKIKIDDFASKICHEMKRKLGDDYKVDVKEIRKNNGVVMRGLVISTSRQNIAPTIYLESFWEEYCNGTSFAETIRRILVIYQKNVPEEKIDLDFFRFFEKVRDRICYRLINRKKNEELLEELPHVEFLDLAFCFYYAYQGDTLGEGTILIHNSHVEMWDTSTAELFRLAQENTPRMFPWVCNLMEEVFREITGCTVGRENRKGQTDIFSEVPMKVLSNQKRVHGAVCLLYPGVMEEIAAEEGGSFYIIPSSVHETIILPYDEEISAGALKIMIHEVNRTRVTTEEVLSDSLYYYDAAKKEIVIL